MQDQVNAPSPAEMPGQGMLPWFERAAERVVETVPCACLPGRSGRPCDREGSHLARWVLAEQQGKISRAALVAVLTRLPVLADHVVVGLDKGAAA